MKTSEDIFLEEALPIGVFSLRDTEKYCSFQGEYILLFPQILLTIKVEFFTINN